MKRKPKLGEILFWRNYATFGVVIDPEFWAKELNKDMEPIKLAVATGEVPLLLLGSLMALKFPFAPEYDPEPKIKHNNLYLLVNPVDLIRIGNAEDLIRFCRCAVCFAGPKDQSYLKNVSDEARAILREEGCIKELAEFFAKAIPKK